MERQHNSEFESAFQGAFQEAETTPSVGLWGKIEADLERSKSSGYKKRLLFFQLMAVASFALAMTVGGVLISDYYFTNQEQTIATIDEKEKELVRSSEEKPGNDQSKTIPTKETLEESGTKNGGDEENVNSNIEKFTSREPDSRATSEASQSNAVKNSNVNTGSSPIIKPSKEDIFSADKIDRLFSFLKTDEIKLIEPEFLSWLAQSDPSNEKVPDNTAGLWTGLNMAAGSFSSNSSGSGAFAADAQSEFVSKSNVANFADLGEEESGRSFSVGLNIGSSLGKRFVLLGGVNYLEQNTTANSNITSENRAVSIIEDLRTGNSIEFVDSYEVNNTYRSLAVPVKLGYYLIDKRIDILLLGGVSNDFFIKKLSSSDESIQTNEFTYQDDGYSLYSIGAIFGTQISYALGDQYSIAIQPQYKRQLTIFTPQEIRPNGFEFGIRLNYIFK